MKHSKLFFSALTIATLAFTSCDDNDDAGLNYEIPTDYTFERNSTTTVDYSGQSSRLLMLAEMGTYIGNAAKNGTVASATVLSNMYSKTNNPFSTSDLNTSGKQLKDKTAASKDYFSLSLGGGSTVEKATVQAFFETQLTNAATASALPQANASAGVAGVYVDGTSKRLFAANGLEPQQILLKGMMGACFLDQVVNNYLSTNKLDESTNVENNTNKVLESGKSYTTMEHLWDEAYGYIYGAGGGKYWDSYITQVNADADFNTVTADIKNAFIKGRAAIVANDYTTRNAQINIIKEKLAIVPAVRAVFYLQEGKAKLTTDNGAKAFHALSEAYGFIMCLRYTNKPGTNAPYFTKAEVDTILSTLTAGTNGLWDVDYLNTKLDVLSTQIATKFGFTVAQAATVN
ncbi:DUF4856 domain-containing protein [Flavobacterium sp. UMI-01]|uniref:DUF4856 domain-containing protein n=1 Tax=Flavobacterium sp. UMI-01 TaxID=1441053 RepID=UPI001C7D182A|nr:DUF4856 domain-containing protein [Flavobacterium sp. UMI-01]GIZ08426.1 DUF4856 domain-containing protein [Flavobacterium sp. UMI-01]